MASKQILTYLLCVLFALPLYALTVSEKLPMQPLLTHAKIYIDHNRSETIDTIGNKPFTQTNKACIGFGYSPDFAVWVRFVLENPTDHPLKRIVEYTNPLSMEVLLYDGGRKTLLYQSGLAHGSPLKSINPAFEVTLPPHTKTLYYLKASTDVTTLIVGLKLWQLHAFWQHESRHQFILALFFGAMAIIILYNLVIYLSVRERAYLYYVLAFAGIVIHHLFYKGMAGLYLLSPEQTAHIVHYAAFIVALPTFFLALFTKEVLKLEQYPKLNRLLHYSLVLFVPAVFVTYFFDLNSLRSLFPVLLLLMLFAVTLYALWHRNRQAKFIMAGWIILAASGTMMFLSSKGYFDIFTRLPYFVEITLLVETLLFSLLLADRLKQLRMEKIASQQQLIAYQKDEEERLKMLVDTKTQQLKQSVKEKDLLLQELNHRVKNSIQTIVSFLRLQIDETEDAAMAASLTQVENRILSISHLYALLHTSHNISTVNAQEYLSLLIEQIQSTFTQEYVNITLHTDLTLDSETAVYCGFIVNEALTNAMQHAFTPEQSGEIHIILTQEKHIYRLIIQDNGKGFDTAKTYDSLGLVIMESLASYQLRGSMQIDTRHGTHIEILWEGRDG